MAVFLGLATVLTQWAVVLEALSLLVDKPMRRGSQPKPKGRDQDPPILRDHNKTRTFRRLLNLTWLLASNSHLLSKSTIEMSPNARRRLILETRTFTSSNNRAQKSQQKSSILSLVWSSKPSKKKTIKIQKLVQILFLDHRLWYLIISPNQWLNWRLIRWLLLHNDKFLHPLSILASASKIMSKVTETVKTPTGSGLNSRIMTQSIRLHSKI